jgi:hypothetical protein
MTGMRYQAAATERTSMSVPSLTPDLPVAKSATTSEPETFSRDYVQELRRENEQWRYKAREEMEAARRERDETAAKARKDAQAAIAEARRAADLRIVQAELKATALAAGMIDVEGLKLLDISGVELNEEGNIVIPASLFADAKKAKPWLFGQASTSSTAATPKIEPPKSKSVREMDDKERRAFEREHGIYR